MRFNIQFSALLIYTLLSLPSCFASDKIEELDELQINFHDKLIPESCYILDTIKNMKENFIKISNVIGENQKSSLLKTATDKELGDLCINGILEVLLRITNPKYKQDKNANFQLSLWLISASIKFHTDDDYKKFIYGYDEKNVKTKNKNPPFDLNIISYTASKYCFALHYTNEIFETYLNNYFQKNTSDSSNYLSAISETYYCMLSHMKNFYLFDGISPDITNTKDVDIIEIATFKILNELEFFIGEIFSNCKDLEEKTNFKKRPIGSHILFKSEDFANLSFKDKILKKFAIISVCEENKGEKSPSEERIKIRV